MFGAVEAQLAVQILTKSHEQDQFTHAEALRLLRGARELLRRVTQMDAESGTVGEAWVALVGVLALMNAPLSEIAEAQRHAREFSAPS